MPHRTKTEPGPGLRAVPLLAADDIPIQLLQPKQRQLLHSIATKVELPKGRIIYRRGSAGAWLYFCQEGIVKTYRDSPGGTRRITAFLFADDMFGLTEAGRYVNTAQALTPVACYRVEKEVLNAVIKQDAALEYQFLCKVTHELRNAQRRAMMLGRRDAPGRLAMFLLMMRHHVPAGTPEGVIPLPMTRADIGAFLGQSRPSIDKACAELTRRGLVQFPNRQTARVVDTDGLERLAADV